MPYCFFISGLTKRQPIPARRRVDQLRRHADVPGVRLKAAPKHIAHAELLAHVAHIDRFAFVGEGRVACDHQQIGLAREIGDDVLRDPIREAFPSGVAR